MRYTRSELKSLIKECLVEILAEGLGGNLAESVTRKNTRGSQPVRQPSVNNAQANQRNSRRVAPQSGALREAVKASSGGDPILESLLADTAATTLQAQIGAEKHGQPIEVADRASMVVSQSTPEELFGDDVTSKWADLAFSAPPLPSRNVVF